MIFDCFHRLKKFGEKVAALKKSVALQLRNSIYKIYAVFLNKFIGLFRSSKNIDFKNEAQFLKFLQNLSYQNYFLHFSKKSITESKKDFHHFFEKNKKLLYQHKRGKKYALKWLQKVNQCRIEINKLVEKYFNMNKEYLLSNDNQIFHPKIETENQKEKVTEETVCFSNEEILKTNYNNLKILRKKINLFMIIWFSFRESCSNISLLSIDDLKILKKKTLEINDYLLDLLLTADQNKNLHPNEIKNIINKELAPIEKELTLFERVKIYLFNLFYLFIYFYLILFYLFIFIFIYFYLFLFIFISFYFFLFLFIYFYLSLFI